MWGRHKPRYRILTSKTGSTSHPFISQIRDCGWSLLEVHTSIEDAEQYIRKHMLTPPPGTLIKYID